MRLTVFVRGCFMRHCTSGLSLPGRLTVSGEDAFEGCGSLTSVTIPKIVPGVGNCAFKRCARQKEVLIPGRKTKIGNHAFGYGLFDEPVPELIIQGREGSDAISGTEAPAANVPLQGHLQQVLLSLQYRSCET